MKITSKFAKIIAIAGVFLGAGVLSAQAATVATCNSVTLNGTITSTNGVSTRAWFEWSTVSSNVSNGSGIKTAEQVYTTPQSFSQYVGGLTSNTTYYYRAVVQNQYGKAEGGVNQFTTSSCGNDTPNSLVTVSTSGATSIATDYATLNGYVNTNGTSDATRWFEWGTSSSLGNSTAHYNQSSSGSFSDSLSGLSANTTYYFRAAARNAQGTVYGSIMSFTSGYSNNYNYNTLASVSTRNADTSSDFAVLNGYVDPNGTNDTVRWFEWGGSQSLGNTTVKLSQGSVASMFSASVTSLASNTTYYYRAAARNSQGTVYGSIMSFTTGNSNNNNGSSVAPSATTLLATETNNSSAKLNGLVFTSANQSSNAWFEWGTNTGLGNKTQTINVGSLASVKHSDYISGLTAGQTYFYRVVAENPYGKAYGTILSFVAGGSTTVVNTDNTDNTVYINTNTNTTHTNTNTVRTITTVVNRGGVTQSLVALTIDGGAELIAIGDKRGYHVTWKNESMQTLKNVVLRVTLPAQMTYEGTTNGTYSAIDNTVVVDIKTLNAGETGETYVFASANRNLVQGQVVVVTANLVYTDANGVQNDAVAYATHRGVIVNSALGASLFGAGTFLPTTLFGWLLLLILVLILVLLVNHIYGRVTEDKN